MRKGAFNIVIGAQAGSESKGKLAAYIAHKYEPDAYCMTASPNAGHTALMFGKRYVSYHLPVSCIMTDAPIFLSAASVINVDILLQEIKALEIDPSRVHIDQRAAIICPGHVLEENDPKGLLSIGSTGQGVGACRRDKLMRKNSVFFAADVPDTMFSSMVHGDVSRRINDMIACKGTILCEMTQGFDLCLEHGIHPHYCTSKIVHPAMAMAEFGVSPRHIGHVYGVLRPYPIRVSNRTGTSGPYAEADEITWDVVTDRCGAPEPLREITTTTKLPRRVFEFSWERFQQFILLCRPDVLCLQFANYLSWEEYGKGSYARFLKWDDDDPKPGQIPGLTRPTSEFILRLEREGGVRVGYVGTGPEHAQMIDMGVGI